MLPPAADLHEDTTLALTATHTFERGANLLCAFREALPEDVEEAAEEEEEEDLLGDVESAPGADEIVSASLLGDGRLSCVLPASARPRTVRVAISTSGGAEWTFWERGMSTTQYDPHAPMEIVSAAPVAGDVATVVTAAGGWLCDRVRAGWRVTVLTPDAVHATALTILGVDWAPGTTLTELPGGRDACVQ